MNLPAYVPFGVHGSWSTKYVAGPPKEKRLAQRKAQAFAAGAAAAGAPAAEAKRQEGVTMGASGWRLPRLPWLAPRS